MDDLQPAQPGQPMAEGREGDPSWVRALLDLRGIRREFLGFEASDAAVAILLTLYLARLERRPLYRTALAVEARVPETTAFRVCDVLLQAGALHRVPASDDKRLVLLTLSDQAALRLRAYLATAAALAPVLV